ncbi:MAG TPA: transglycosylase SLT domain-containing protein [Nitrolancea sp.]|nr:transglycosylase SLT domain-containing protein [Nitrolancea sp.]
MFARRYRLYHILVVAILLVLALSAVAVDKLILDRSHGPQPSVPLAAIGTPTTAEAQQLAAANKLFAEGHDEDALTALKPLMTASNPATAAQAAMATARIQIALSNSLAASDTLSALRDHYPQTPEGNDAELMLAQIHATQGQRDRAIKELTDFGKRNPDVSPYVDLLISEYLVDEGKSKDALAKVQALAARTDVIERVTIEALEQVRAIQLQRGDNDAYIKTTNQLLDLATVPGYRAELIYERGNAEKEHGDTTAAANDLNEVVKTYPDSSYALQAAAALSGLNSNTAVPSQQIGLLNYDAGNYQDAIAAFNDALSVNPFDDTAWYYRAMSTLRAGDDETATTQLSELPVKFPKSTHIADALYTAGRLNEGYGNLQTAHDDYQSAITHDPTSDTANNARLRLGFVLYLQGKYQNAIDTLKQVNGDSDQQAQASFWQGKAFQQLNQSDNANAAWQKATQADPLGYYGQRAAQLLAGATTAVEAASPDQTMNQDLSAEQRTAIDRWYANAGTTEEIARAAVLQSPSYQRWKHLTALGLTRQAGWELSDFADQHDHNLPVLVQFGVILQESGQYIDAYKIGLALDSDAQSLGETYPDAFNRSAFPLAYAELVQSNAAKHQVDPLLFLALVRQESGYDPSVTSAADARGLAQIVPDTAKVMADALGQKNWNPDLLYRPYVGVEFGTMYLHDRLSIFKGSIVQALAAYNAGDGNASEWASEVKSDDPDVYVESIPFAETYDYDKKVYANYLNYVRLYR